MKRIIYIVLLFLGIYTSSCQTSSLKKTNSIESKEMKKYDIDAASCSPRFYPNEIVFGKFSLEDGYELYIPKGNSEHLGWGNAGSLHVGGPDLKAIPVMLDITWLSFVEKKFYTGRFKLDKELIAELFRKGYKDSRNIQETFSTVMAGMAPGGVVVVWLGGGDARVEVGRYQAKETHKVTKEDIIPHAIISVEEYIEEILKEDLEESHQNKEFMNNIPFGLWDTYREKYTWKPSIVFDGDGKMITVYLECYNAERTNTAAENPEITNFKKRAIPKYVNLTWEDKKGNKYGADIYFGNLYGSVDKIYKEMEDEIFNAFKNIFKDEEHQAELLFKIDKYNSAISIYLKNKTDSIAIKKVKMEVYSIEE